MRLVVFLFLIQLTSQAWAQSVVYMWYQQGGIAFCGEYTPDHKFISQLHIDNCRSASPTTSKWYQQDGRTFCGEFTSSDWIVDQHHNDHCRKTVNGGLTGASSSTPKLTIAEINQNLQPQEGTQVILADDLAVPRNQGCGAPQDTKDNVQCYICQTQSTRNSVLYTKGGILEIGAISMLESRNEIQISLVNSDDLGAIRCLSKNKSEIKISKLEELMKVLDDSGIKFKDPGFIVKTIGTSK